MSNWNLNLTIGDRVNVTLAHTTRDPRTHQIVVKHSSALGKIDTIDLDSQNVGVRFDDGRIHDVHNFQIQKVA